MKFKEAMDWLEILVRMHVGNFEERMIAFGIIDHLRKVFETIGDAIR